MQSLEFKEFTESSPIDSESSGDTESNVGLEFSFDISDSNSESIELDSKFYFF